MGNTPGEVTVYGRDDRDNLAFNKDIFIPHTELQIDGDSYKKLLKLLALKVVSLKSAEKVISKLYHCILIYKHCRKRDNKLKR
jgi:hypothetical protein